MLEKTVSIPEAKQVNTTIDNFKRVDDNLYRGALPSPHDFLALKKQGFDYVISLRSGFDQSGRMEKTFVEQVGMKYINFPIDSRKGPDDKLIKEFFNFTKTLKDNNKIAFIHCKHGKDRTGTMVALYQLKFKIKEYHKVINELFVMGYNYTKHPHFLEIIKRYSKNI